MKLLTTCLLLLSFPLMAAPYQINYEESTIEFSGTHAGDEFTGEFEKWNAEIDFDVNNTDNSSVIVTFDTASAKTGNAMYDGTLPAADWFDVKNYPEATFTSTSFAKNDDGYSVTGDLTIRDITHPITFDFELNGDAPTIMTAEFPINRLKFDIGKKSDGDAEWVGQTITMNLKISATK